MTNMISVEDGQPIWIDVTFCHDCIHSVFDPTYNKDQPCLCLLWHEWMHTNDFCSYGKED